MSTADMLESLVRDLGEACGFELALVDGSIIVEGAYVAATARSPARSSIPRPVAMEALAKVLISPHEAGGVETWALVFFFVNGQRVAPPGMSHLTLKLEPDAGGASHWVAREWEADIYEEWTGLERLSKG